MKSSTNIIMLFVCIVFLVGDDLRAEKKKSAPKKVAPSGGSVVSTGSEGDYVIEKRSDGTKVKYKKKTQYDFEGANVEGIYNKPSGSYISNIKDVKARSIIRVRENFDSEVVDSSRSVR